METTVKEKYITTTQGMSGFFAVMLWWNDELGPDKGFWEPWMSGFGRYKTREEAVDEAKGWADSEGLEYKE